MQDYRKEIQSLELEISNLVQQRRGTLNEMKRLEKSLESINNEIIRLRNKLDEEKENHRKHLEAFKRAVAAHRQAASTIGELRKRLKEKQMILKTLDQGGPLTSVSKVEDELKEVERMIETRPLSREEERRLVRRARGLAVRLKELQLLMKAKAEFEQTFVVFSKLKTEMENLSSVLSTAGPRVAEAGERITRLKHMLKQLRDEKAAIEADMLELSVNYAETSKKIEALRLEKRGILAAMRKFAEEKTLSERRVELESARRKVLEKVQRGEKLTLEELKLIYGDSDKEP